jgi:hypothetical protein
MGRVLQILKSRSEGQEAHEDGGASRAGHLPDVEDRSCDRPSEPLQASGEIPFVEVPEVAGQRTTEPPASTAMAPRERLMRMSFQRAPCPDPDFPIGIGADFLLWKQPAHPTVQAYRALRDTLLSELAAHHVRSLSLVPVMAPYDPRISVHLALALAEGGQRAVVLVDTDVDRPRVAGLLGLAPSPGWSEYLAGLMLGQVLQETGWGRLHFLAAGNRLVRTPAMIGGTRARRALAQLSQRYDLVLLQSAPWPDGAAAAMLAPLTDALCLIDNVPSAEAGAAKRYEHAVQRQGLPLLGTIAISD